MTRSVGTPSLPATCSTFMALARSSSSAWMVATATTDGPEPRTMRGVPGSGPSVVAVATIHAEDDDLAKAMKVEQVAGKLGVPTLRVIYPLDRGNTIRYP